MLGTQRGALEALLVKIRDGGGDPAALAEARALVSADPRVPDELRGDLLADDPVDDAIALLAILGVDDGGFGAILAAAIADEAGPLEIDLTELEGPFDVPVGEAVVAAAGPAPELWASVAGSLGIVAAPSLGDALRAAAGPVPELWASVAAEIGAGASVPVGEAVRAAAGPSPALWPTVSRELGIARQMPAAVVEAPRVPRAANSTRWSLRGLALLAAAALVSVAVWRWPDPGASMTANTVGVASIDASTMVFANVQDSQVVELSYGDEVNVVQVEGDQGALILWVDDTEGGS